MPDTTPPPLSPERLAEMRQRLTQTRDVAALSEWPLEDYHAVKRQFGDTAALLAEVERLRARVAELERERGDVIELTWRPQDILLGDDDTADLMLTTKDGRPANWRLDPDQRRALADDLAPEGAETVEEWGVRDHRDPAFIAPQSERDHAEKELQRARHFGVAAEPVTRTATYGPWQPVDEDGGEGR